MTTCKIIEITPPATPPAPAERTFTLTLTGHEERIHRSITA